VSKIVSMDPLSSSNQSVVETMKAEVEQVNVEVDAAKRTSEH
jgi:hypothetical protein